MGMMTPIRDHLGGAPARRHRSFDQFQIGAMPYSFRSPTRTRTGRAIRSGSAQQRQAATIAAPHQNRRADAAGGERLAHHGTGFVQAMLRDFGAGSTGPNHHGPSAGRSAPAARGRGHRLQQSPPQGDAVEPAVQEQQRRPAWNDVAQDPGDQPVSADPHFEIDSLHAVLRPDAPAVSREAPARPACHSDRAADRPATPPRAPRRGRRPCGSTPCG